jgi:hypothetical protein
LPLFACFVKPWTFEDQEVIRRYGGRLGIASVIRERRT